MCCDICNEVVCDDDCENIYKRANNLGLLKKRDERIKILTKDDKSISAFAYQVGRSIEKLINERTNDLEKTNQILEAKILGWWTENGRDEKYAEYFGIKATRDGRKI